MHIMKPSISVPALPNINATAYTIHMHTASLMPENEMPALPMAIFQSHTVNMLGTMGPGAIASIASIFHA